MIYEWKCTKCDKQVTITRPVAEYKLPPEHGCPSCEETSPQCWKRVIHSVPSDWEHMRNKGILERLD